MNQLTKIKRFRFSQMDLLLFEELRKHQIKPSRFLRDAFREKIARDLPNVIKQEKINRSKEYCPF